MSAKKQSNRREKQTLGKGVRSGTSMLDLLKKRRCLNCAEKKEKSRSKKELFLRRTPASTDGQKEQYDRVGTGPGGEKNRSRKGRCFVYKLVPLKKELHKKKACRLNERCTETTSIALFEQKKS